MTEHKRCEEGARPEDPRADPGSGGCSIVSKIPHGGGLPWWMAKAIREATGSVHATRAGGREEPREHLGVSFSTVVGATHGRVDALVCAPLAMRSICILALCVPLGSCGAIMTTGCFHVPVESRPAGAVVVHEGKQVGVTPCVVMVTRASRLFELHLAGYHPEVVDVGTTRNWWVAGNFVTLGLGMVVDVIVGADRKPDTDQVVIDLLRADGPGRGRWVRSRSTPEPQLWPEPSGLGYLVGALLQELARNR